MCFSDSSYLCSFLSFLFIFGSNAHPFVRVCADSGSTRLAIICPLHFQAFSPLQLPSLTSLNLRGNPLEQNSNVDLLKVLREFPSLTSLEVIMFIIIFKFVGLAIVSLKPRELFLKGAF